MKNKILDGVDCVMFEKILVPIDGSEISKKAVSKAVEMAKELGSTIVVANIMNQKNSFSFDMQDDESRDFVSAMVDYIKGEDVAVESMILFGSPEFDVEKVARKSEADVMLLGCNVKESLDDPIGSFTKASIRHVKLPIILIK